MSHGQRAGAPDSSPQRAHATRAPSPAAMAPSSSAIRVLPIPASPVRTTAAGLTGGGLRPDRAEQSHLGGPPDEGAVAGRTDPRLRGRPRWQPVAGRRHEAERRVLREDLRFEPRQARAGIDAQLLAQQRTGGVAFSEGVGLAAAAVERPHQQLAEPLPQRMLGREALHLRHGRDGIAGVQHRLAVDLLGGQAQLLQAGDRGRGERLEREVGVRGTAPPAQRLDRDPPGLRRVTAAEQLAPWASRRSKRMASIWPPSTCST